VASVSLVFYLFIYLFFVILTYYDIIARFCLLHYSFLSVMEINVGTALNNAQLMHPLTSGIHDSKHGIFAKGGHFKRMT